MSMVTPGHCPNCGRCPYLEGQCIERVSKGRRFFLMGALALPVAHTLSRAAAIVQPQYETPTLERVFTAANWTATVTWSPEWIYSVSLAAIRASRVP